MKSFGFVLAIAIALMGAPAAEAFSQADVDRMLAGDKNMQGADLSGITQINLTTQTYKNVDFRSADFRGSRSGALFSILRKWRAQSSTTEISEARTSIM